MSAQSHRLFADLEPVSDFRTVLDADRYHALPDDWLVAVADVMGSTKVIEEGRYKDINSLGASAIMAVLNASGNVPLPYVFGGDGASFVIPPDLLEPVAGALHGTQQLAWDGFGLSLRAGLVPVGVIRERQADVRVLRFRLSDGITLSMFAGGGMSVADDMVKSTSEGDAYAISGLVDEDVLAAHTPDYRGMQCRWDKIKSRNGVTVSLLVSAADMPGYIAALDAVDTVLGDDSEGYHPVQPAQLSLAQDFDAFHTESVIQTYGKSQRSKRLYQHLTRIRVRIGRQLFARGMKLGDFDGAKYPKQLHANTDFRKFDDMLRMIIDVTPDQAKALRDALDEADLTYGMHESDASLMTCLVFGYDNRHVHFVDGADGGYAMAARQLKQRLKKRQKERQKQAGDNASKKRAKEERMISGNA